MFDQLKDLILAMYPGEHTIALHRPLFSQDEESAVAACIRSSYVSSIGPDIEKFEQHIAEFCSSGYAISTVNGTAALHLSLHAIGVSHNDIVLTQSLSFAATGHAILQTGAKPVYIDITMPQGSMCPEALLRFLSEECRRQDDICTHKISGRRIAACVPMHSFGEPAKISQIEAICREWSIPLIEDAAEALGSFIDGKHCGTFGLCGVLSFNGNKIMTTGAGGIILCKNEALAKRLKHLSTTAKIPDPFEFRHSETGFNYRLPNLNASLGIAQFRKLPNFLNSKRAIHRQYQTFFQRFGYELVNSPEAESNHWLNTVIMNSPDEKESLLKFLKAYDIQARPAWYPLHRQTHLQSVSEHPLPETEWLYSRAVSLPSSVPLSV
ncbi:MAG: LegC family aminotransferase [Saccharospirillaceae bacterium]|nr:LegC family aminotransferase [Saccharospirillaceae bacterium]MCD8530957.1 LegC family aminotransferase [Saccharospirillaceae bacterium]